MAFKYAPRDPALAAFTKPATQPASPPARSPAPPAPPPPSAAPPRPLTTGKTLVSLRIDTDVLERFKASGKGWQRRINATLRDVAF